MIHSYNKRYTDQHSLLIENDNIFEQSIQINCLTNTFTFQLSEF